MKKPHAIVFDWDNTLVDSFPAIYSAFNATLEAMGQAPWSLEEARARIGPPGNVIFPELFEDQWEKANQIYYERFSSGDCFAEILSGAPALLEAVRSLKIEMAVVSAKRADILRREARQLKLDHYFFKIAGTGDAPADKPDPAILDYVLEGRDLKAGPDIWYVGDHLTDMKLAHASGCTAILVNGADIEDKIPEVLKPDFVFQNCEALTVFLQARF